MTELCKVSSDTIITVQLSRVNEKFYPKLKNVSENGQSMENRGRGGQLKSKRGRT